MDGHTFIVELTMGVLTVYFPSQSKWDASAPDWAKNQWERVIPLNVEERAWVMFEPAAQ